MARVLLGVGGVPAERVGGWLVLLLQHIVRQYDKQTLEAAMELDTNSAEQVVDLGLGEG